MKMPAPDLKCNFRKAQETALEDLRLLWKHAPRDIKKRVCLALMVPTIVSIALFLTVDNLNITIRELAEALNIDLGTLIHTTQDENTLTDPYDQFFLPTLTRGSGDHTPLLDPVTAALEGIPEEIALENPLPMPPNPRLTPAPSSRDKPKQGRATTPPDTTQPGPLDKPPELIPEGEQLEELAQDHFRLTETRWLGPESNAAGVSIVVHPTLPPEKAHFYITGTDWEDEFVIGQVKIVKDDWNVSSPYFFPLSLERNVLQATNTIIDRIDKNSHRLFGIQIKSIKKGFIIDPNNSIQIFLNQEEAEFYDQRPVLAMVHVPVINPHTYNQYYNNRYTLVFAIYLDDYSQPGEWNMRIKLGGVLIAESDKPEPPDIVIQKARYETEKMWQEIKEALTGR